ncbi:MAG: zinc-ribbon domain containing protein [Chloroflexi bacterium]|nr:zinc-ribbon domain containing protein [Chloroflexota bacterium]
MSYSDQTLACRDCGQAFTFTVGEQEFFAARGFDTPPTRCPGCRRARRASRESGSYDYGSYGSDESSSRSYRGSRELFTVTCSSCGQDARVPFQPRGDRPVYCSACFESQRGGSSSRTSRSYR